MKTKLNKSMYNNVT